MKKEFSISNDKVTLNFTAKYCKSYAAVLRSSGFKQTLDVYLKRGMQKNSSSYMYLSKALDTDSRIDIRDNLISVFKYLTIAMADEVKNINKNFENLLADKDKFIAMVEDLYLFWRKLERYTIIYRQAVKKQGLAAVSFTDANARFSQLILDLYRCVEKNVIGHLPTVYRQIPAGGNAGIMLRNFDPKLPAGYEKLADIPFVDQILLETPFITYPKKNTRDGTFQPVEKNPLENASINPDHFYCFPAKIGGMFIYIYFHRDFMEHGITLCNLFEMARNEEIVNRKPEMVFVFGAREESENPLKTIFYEDKENDIMLGYINYSPEIDYFGYMKKMTLTLYNLLMIKKGYLPIHGSMVNILLKDGSEANVVIMGDSGAGKSESLEAFRSLSEDYISEMTIVFDDMGTFKLENDRIMGYGTEIGAFVRLDDLDPGYAFREIDRSIFMNPDKVNARLVTPAASYKTINKGYAVDYFFYANNYDRVEEGGSHLSYFETAEEAKPVFRRGARMAKGTTTEKGLVESFFANPFGPVQKKEETNVIIDKYFDAMFDGDSVKVGQIKTCLGVKGQEKDGPRNAALELFDVIKKMDKNKA